MSVLLPCFVQGSILRWEVNKMPKMIFVWFQSVEFAESRHFDSTMGLSRSSSIGMIKKTIRGALVDHSMHDGIHFAVLSDAICQICPEGKLICIKWRANHVFYPGCWQAERRLSRPIQSKRDSAEDPVESTMLRRRFHSLLSSAKIVL